jgi:hypothetical protein
VTDAVQTGSGRFGSKCRPTNPKRERNMNFKIAVLIIFITGVMIVSTAPAAEFQFTPRASAKGEYTDNVFLSGENARDEYILTLSAGFSAALLGRTGGIEVSYDPAYEFYDEFDDNDGWTHNASLVAWSDLTRRTRFEVANRFLLARDPLGEDDFFIDDEVAIEGDTTNRTTREEYYTNTANATITHQFGADDSVYAGFIYRILRNDDPETEDSDQYEPSVGLNFWFAPKFGIETRGVYTKGDFDQDSDFTGEPTDDFENWFGSLRTIVRASRHFSIFGQYDQIYRDYDGDNDDDYLVYSPSAGILYLVEEGLSLRLGLGYFYQEIDNDDDNDGYYLNGEIDKRWSYRRGSVNLNGSSGLDQNNFGAENIGLERFAQIRGGLQYDFFRDLSGNVSGSFRYADAVNTDESDGIGEQFRTRGGAGLSYMPLSWMTWALEYTYTNYAADGDINYDENRVMLTLTLQPDRQ